MNKQIRFLNKLELVGAFLFLGYWFLELEPLKTIFLILSAILIIPIVGAVFTDLFNTGLITLFLNLI